MSQQAPETAATAAETAPAAAAGHHPSKAEKLSARWNMLRSDHASLYDVLVWHPLKWPSLALQWQPASWQSPQLVQDLQLADAEELEARREAAAESSDEEMQKHSSCSSSRDLPADCRQQVLMPVEYRYLLMGDQTAQAEGRHLSLWQVRLPGPLPAGYSQDQGLVIVPAKMEPVVAIRHGMQDVNRLHSMPSQPHIVATCCDEPQLYLFDLGTAAEHQQQQQQQQQQQRSSEDGGSEDNSSSSLSRGSLSTAWQSGSQQQSDALVELGGRTVGGYGLEWHPHMPGLLLGADIMGGVQLWDVQAGSANSSTGRKQIHPLQACPGFAGCAINAVSWHSSSNTFAAATEQGQILLQDIRSSSSAVAATAHLHSISPSSSRSERVHVRRHCRGQGTTAPDCLTVEFDPNHPHRLASGGADGYTCILDMRKLAEPLEQLGLHADSVTQVSWSKGAVGVLASASQDGHILLWDCNKMQHMLSKQPKAAGASAAAHALQGQAAARCSLSAGVGIGKPRRTKYSEAVAKLGLPGLLFAHHGHIGAVDALAWNPDRPWMLASCSPVATAKDGQGQEVEVQPAALMVWEVNRSVGLLC